MNELEACGETVNAAAAPLAEGIGFHLGGIKYASGHQQCNFCSQLLLSTSYRVQGGHRHKCPNSLTLLSSLSVALCLWMAVGGVWHVMLAKA